MTTVDKLLAETEAVLENDLDGSMEELENCFNELNGVKGTANGNSPEYKALKTELTRLKDLAAGTEPDVETKNPAELRKVIVHQKDEKDFYSQRFQFGHTIAVVKLNEEQEVPNCIIDVINESKSVVHKIDKDGNATSRTVPKYVVEYL